LVPRHLIPAERLWALGADSPGTERVFTAPEGGALNYSNLRQRVLDPARKAAGVEWVTFHTFRHTFASLAFAAGRNVTQISAWLGHSDSGFTQKTYVHLMDEGVGDAAFMDTAVTVAEPGTLRLVA
jgi:integrase